MVESTKLLAVLSSILSERGENLDDWLELWDQEAGYKRGRTKQLLSPQDGLVLNRNVRLAANRLGISGNALYAQILALK